MAVVGSAYVIVRAISKSLEKDITKGVKDAVNGVLPEIDKATADIGKKVGKNVAKEVGDPVAKALDTIAPEAEKAGKKAGEAVDKGLTDRLRAMAPHTRAASARAGAEIRDTISASVGDFRVLEDRVSRAMTQVGRTAGQAFARAVPDPVKDVGRQVVDNVRTGIDRSVTRLRDAGRQIGNEVTRSITDPLRRNTNRIVTNVREFGDRVGTTLVDSVATPLRRNADRLVNEAHDLGERLGTTIGNSVVTPLQRNVNKYVTAARKVGDRVGRAYSDAMESPLVQNAVRHVATARRIGDRVGNALSEGIVRPIRRVGAQVGRTINDMGRAIGADAKRVGERVGNIFGTAFTQGVARPIQSSTRFISQTTSRTFNKAWQLVRADNGGKNLGNRFIKGFLDAVNEFKIPPIVWIGFFGIGALGGILKIVASYVASAISLVSAIGPAIAGAGIAGAAGVGVLGAAVGAVIAALKTKTPLLTDFKDALKGIGNEFSVVGKAAQKELLPKLITALDVLVKIAPVLAKGLRPVAGAIGDVAIQLAKVATNKGNIESLNGIMAATPGILKPLGSALGSVLTIFLDLAQAGAPLLRQFVEFVARWLDMKRAALDAAEANGKLADSVAKMERVGKQVGRILGNVGRGIAGIFKAASGSGQDILDSIEAVTKRFDNWVNSDYGQTKLAKFFESSREIMRAVNRLIGDALVALGQPIGNGKTDNIIAFVETLRTKGLPALERIATAAGKLAPSLVPLFESIANLVEKMSASGALGKFFDTLKGIVDLFTKLFQIPVVGDLLGWSLGFLGMTKAVNFVLKPIGGLKTILGPLGKLLFGSQKNAGLLSKAFGGLEKEGGKAEGAVGKIKTAVGKLGKGLWTGAATAVKLGFSTVLKGIEGLSPGLAAKVGSTLSKASRLIPWANIGTAATSTKIASAFGGVVGPAAEKGIAGVGWKAMWTRLIPKIFGPLGAALLVVDVGHFLLPIADEMVAWLTTKLPEPLAKGLQAAWLIVQNHPIIKDMRAGVEGVMDNLWPDHWPWEDPPPDPVPPNLDKFKTAVEGAAKGVQTAVTTLVTKIQDSKVAEELGIAFDVANSKTHGALGRVIDTINGDGQKVVTQAGKVATGALDAIKSAFGAGPSDKVVAQITAMMTGVAGVFSSNFGLAIQATQGAMNSVRIAIQTAKGSIQTAASTAAGTVRTAFATAMGAAIAAAQGGMTNVQKAIVAAKNGVTTSMKTAVSGLVGAVNGATAPAIAAAKTGMTNVQRAIAAAKAAVTAAARSAASGVAPTVQSAVSRMKTIGGQGIANFASGMRGQITNVQRAAASAAARAKPIIATGRGSAIYNAGAAVISGFVAGMRARFQAVIDAATRATQLILANKGPIEKDRVLLTPAGNAVMDGFLKGLEARMPVLRSRLQAFTSEISRMGLNAGAPSFGDPRDAALAAITPGGTRAVAAAGQQSFTWNVYNPVNEKTSQTTVKAATRTARIGAFK